MNSIGRIPAVFLFEWRRALTIPRLAWMAALMAFPPILSVMIRTTAGEVPPVEAAAILVYVLSPCVACMMGVFLWATPALSSELEGRSWVYLAVRPHGPISVMIGKYLVAVSWSIPVGIVSASLAVVALGADQMLRTIGVQCALAVLSCVSYSAVFLLIGVIAPKRAMVLGILYAIIFEMAFALIPAAVNLLTVQFRLRCLLVRWMSFDVAIVENNPIFAEYFGVESSLWHVSALLAMTLFYLVATAALLHYREFTAASETDT